MLNEKKIRIMIDLSRYENQSGKDELKIAKYYRSDYLGFALFRNFFLTTLGYGIVLALIALYHMEYLLSNIHRMNIVYLAGVIVVGYIALLFVYSVATYVRYSIKYRNGRRGVHLYDRKLAQLLEMYGKEENTKNAAKSNTKNMGLRNVR